MLIPDEQQIVKHDRKSNIAHILWVGKVPALKSGCIYTFQKVWIASSSLMDECSEYPP